jgi:hypothetical protein
MVSSVMKEGQALLVYAATQLMKQSCRVPTLLLCLQAVQGEHHAMQEQRNGVAKLAPPHT